MPKQKISKTVRDRFKITGTGKILRGKIGHRHNISKKSRANVRRGKKPVEVTGVLAKKLKKLLGI